MVVKIPFPLYNKPTTTAYTSLASFLILSTYLLFYIFLCFALHKDYDQDDVAIDNTDESIYSSIHTSLHTSPVPNSTKSKPFILQPLVTYQLSILLPVLIHAPFNLPIHFFSRLLERSRSLSRSLSSADDTGVYYTFLLPIVHYTLLLTFAFTCVLYRCHDYHSTCKEA